MATTIGRTKSVSSERRNQAFSIEAIIGTKATDDTQTQRTYYDNRLRFVHLSQRFDQINRNCIRSSIVSDIDLPRTVVPRITSLDPRILSSADAPDLSLHRFQGPLSLFRDADGFDRVCRDRPFNFGLSLTRPSSVHPIPTGLIPWLSYRRTLLDPSSKQPLYYDWLVSRPDMRLSSAMVSGRGISKYLFLTAEI